MRGRERASGVFCFRAAPWQCATKHEHKTARPTDISDFRGAEFSLNLRRSSAYPMSMTPGNVTARNRSCLLRHTSSVRVAGDRDPGVTITQCKTHMPTVRLA